MFAPPQTRDEICNETMENWKNRDLNELTQIILASATLQQKLLDNKDITSCGSLKIHPKEWYNLYFNFNNTKIGLSISYPNNMILNNGIPNIIQTTLMDVNGNLKSFAKFGYNDFYYFNSVDELIAIILKLALEIELIKKELIGKK